MHIVVCMKQVPDTSEAKFDAETGRLKRDALPTTVNALDEHAVEAALRIKEKAGDAVVTALTFGPEKAVDAVKHAVAMGADAAVHVTDPAFAGSDAAATARVLAHAVAKLDEPALILCGAETMDGATASTAPRLATLLGLPYVAFVTKIESFENGTMVVHRMMETAADRVECPAPALLSVVKGVNEPRISSLKGKMKAKKTKPEVLGLGDLEGLDADAVGAAGSPTRVVKTFPPQPRPEGVILEGEPDEMAEKLVQYLKR